MRISGQLVPFLVASDKVPPVRQKHPPLDDPKTHFMVGQLVGAAKMSAAAMRKSDDGQLKDFADRLDAAANWFLEPQRINLPEPPPPE